MNCICGSHISFDLLILTLDLFLHFSFQIICHFTSALKARVPTAQLRVLWLQCAHFDGCLVIEVMVRGAAVLCCGCSPAHFDVDQRKVGWLTGRLAGHLFEIQGNAFLLRSSCFLMILNLQELQWGVRLINFQLFSLLKSIFKKISLMSIWIKQEAVDLVKNHDFKKMHLSNENK